MTNESTNLTSSERQIAQAEEIRNLALTNLDAIRDSLAAASIDPNPTRRQREGIMLALNMLQNIHLQSDADWWITHGNLFRDTAPAYWSDDDKIRDIADKLVEQARKYLARQRERGWEKCAGASDVWTWQGDGSLAEATDAAEAVAEESE